MIFRNKNELDRCVLPAVRTLVMDVCRLHGLTQYDLPSVFLRNSSSGMCCLFVAQEFEETMGADIWKDIEHMLPSYYVEWPRSYQQPRNGRLLPR